MSPFFDQLEDQLRRAAQARAVARRTETPDGSPAGDPGAAPTSAPLRRPGRWAWLAVGMRAAPAVAAVAVTVVVAVAALVLLGHNPTPASPPPAVPAGVTEASRFRQLFADWAHAPKQELRIINQAQNSALPTHACQSGQTGTPRQTEISATPSPALLSQLSVLRRPATAADRLPTNALPGPTPVYAGAARLAVSAGGAEYYLVPARSDPGAGQPGSACFAAERTALQRLLPHLPASMRAATVKLLSEQIAAQLYQRSRPSIDIVCLVIVGHNYGSSFCGENATQIRKGQIPQATGGGPQPGGEFSQVGIAPDGVATVALTWATPGHHHVTITAPVHDNVYIASSPPNGAMASMTWRAADGRQLNVIDAHTGANVAHLCRNRRSAKCIAALTLAVSNASSGYGTSYGSASSSSSSATQTTAAATPATTTKP